MHNSLLVQIPDCKDDLGRIKLHDFLGESFVLLEDFVQFTTLYERHHEVESRIRLEQVLHTHEERVLATEENVLLQLSVLYLIVVN